LSEYTSILNLEMIFSNRPLLGLSQSSGEGFHPS
jgi:hypothetical protein